MSLSHIPNIIPILSGKGGVGKSSVTVQLALTLTLDGHKVGILDVDLTGPSIPRLFAVESQKIRQAPGGWLPVQVCSPQALNKKTEGSERGSLFCMSLGFLLHDRGDAVIWRGPKKTAMVKQLLSDVIWPPDMEYLLIDTPPGTSDEHISLMTNLLDPSQVKASQKLGAVIVTTPQAISTADVRKELSFCQKTNLPVLGIVENMAGYICPCCGEVTNIFSKGGGQIMARDWNVAFLGSVPLDSEGWGSLIEQNQHRQDEGLEEDAHLANAVISTPDDDPTQTVKWRTRDPSYLLQNFSSCVLYPVFKDIVHQILPFNTTTALNQPET